MTQFLAFFEKRASGSGWRLPTDNETKLFVLGAAKVAQNANPVLNTDFSVSGVWNAANIGLCTFKNPYDPTGTTKYTLAPVTLPAAGYRTNIVAGNYGGQGTHGYYWHSVVSGTQVGCMTFVQNRVSPNDLDPQFVAAGIRCVPVQAGELEPDWVAPDPKKATGAEILYFTDLGYLQLGHWDTPANTNAGALGRPLTNINQLAYFKFGGIVGITQHSGLEYNATNMADIIKFSPRAQYKDNSGVPQTLDGTWGVVGDDNKISTYAPAMPSYGNTPGDTNLVPVGANLSDAFHVQRLEYGKGDPCRLVGLSSQTAQAMSLLELQAYDSGWRTPTNAQNIAFVGNDGSNTGNDPVYYKPSGTFAAAYSGNDVGIGQYPQSNNVQLPATGYRTHIAGVMNVGIMGYFFSSTVHSTTSARAMDLAVTWSLPWYQVTFDIAFTRRCVPK